MKKKVALLLTIAALCITATGCSVELPFKKDKVDDTENVSSTDDTGMESGTSGVEVLNGATFTVGSTISVYDLVLIPEEMGTPTMAAIIDSNGMIKESIEATEVGEMTYEIAIDFENGDSFGDVVSFTVVDDSAEVNDSQEVEQSNTVELPADLVYNLNRYDWSSIFIPTYDVVNDLPIDTSVIISTNDSIVKFIDTRGVFPAQINLIDGSPSSYNGYRLSIGFIDKDLESRLNDLDISPIRSVHPFAKFDVDFFISYSVLTQEDEYVDLSEEQIQQYHDWYYQMLDEIISIRTGDTGYKVYDSDGTEYPVNIVLGEVNFSAIGIDEYDEFTMAFFYYIEYNDGYIVIRVPTDSAQHVLPYEPDEENLPIPESYEDMISSYDPTKEFMAYDFYDNVEEAQSVISAICNNIIIGDYTTIKSQEPVNEEGSVEINVETTGEEEEQELTGAVGKIGIKYEDKYPEIYEDRWGEKKYVYRRWVYNIDNNTSYIGSIIPKGVDGVIQTGGATVEVPDNYDTTDPSTVNDPEENTPVERGFSLSSAYNTYKITNGGNQNIVFNTAASTSGRLALQYNGVKYYIETVRASQVNNYISDCLYSTSTFKDGSYSVVEGSGAVNTDIGTISPYIIRYEDLNGVQKEIPYMAIYNIDNDYLCVYADTLPTGSSNVFVDMLRDMVTIQ